MPLYAGTQQIKLVDSGGAPTDAVRFSPQDLNNEQQAQVRENIGFPTVTEADVGKSFSVDADGNLVLITAATEMEWEDF